MICFQQVSKAFGTQEVLTDVSFVVHPGERVGIVGPNGAGKSTIFDLLIGRLTPDRGEASVPGGLNVGYVRQQLRPHQTDASLLGYVSNAIPALREIRTEIEALEKRLDALSGDARARELRRLGDLQTKFEHLGGYDLKNRAETTLSGLGFEVAGFGQPFRSFSGGWQMRAELARMLVSGPDVLLLDEPTNYLDAVAVEWLQDFLRNFHGTLLLVSHDRYLLNSLTSVTLEVAGAQVTRYPGNYAHYVQERQLRRRQLLAAKKNQDRKREQIERFIERFRAKNTKSSQVQSRVKMLEKMEEIRVPPEARKLARISLSEPPPCGVEVVRIEDAGVSYDARSWVLRHVDLRIENGDKVALVGLNGMGKTTLLRVLAGALPLKEGTRTVGPRTQIGYQSQDYTDVMAPDVTVFDTAKRAAAERSDGEVRGLLAGFGFAGDAVSKKVEVLSGGEKVRLALAQLLLRPCNLLLLDEPTTHLDIDARLALEQALRDYKGTLCLVSHDIEFLRQLAATVLALTPEGVTRYYGGYDYYREKLARDRAGKPTEDEPDPAPLGAGGHRKARRREHARLRQELYARKRPLEEKIAAAEQQLADLEEEQHLLVERLQNAGDGANFEQLNRRLAENQAERERATETWEQASIQLEDLLEGRQGTV